ncbi:winged helix DNA-binding domain-containing protein [Agromyces archimandritae]|uniref:AlkZ family DNA glycosylase n=1 Tax=Agromyces archimandritae TaxID=2781962 RepID=A0A975FN40_9MICO|nr:winged helix DNA-binding domain-containing protein [Agromyces archimandritae]QTX04727.1 AlkZ family DNA glycosylase [Agromyces archimandritae]
MTTTALRSARLASHGLSRPVGGAADVVGRLGAVQGQDFGALRWAIGARMPRGARAADIDRALEARLIVRGWPMRGTLHAVDPALFHPLVSLTGERVLRQMAGRRRALGIDDGLEHRARAVLEHELAGGSRSREEIREAWRAAGLEAERERGSHLLYGFAVTGLICLGPVSGNRQRYVLTEEWMPKAPPRSHDEALALALTSYVRGHAPASVEDFAWWAGLTKHDARRAREIAGAALVEEAGLLSPADGPEASARPGGSYALAGFDEYYLGYSARDRVAPAGAMDLIVPGRNGMFLPILVHGGRVVGTWRRVPRGKAGTDVEVRAFDGDGAAMPERFAPSLARWAAFAGTQLGEVRPAA